MKPKQFAPYRKTSKRSNRRSIEWKQNQMPPVRPFHSRKLRIAWSVAWGVVAVLLCVLWVRSY